MNIRGLLVLLALASILLTNCDNKNRLQIELPSTDLNIEVVHFDVLLFNEDSTARANELAQLNVVEQRMFEELVEKIMRVSAVDDPYMMQKFDDFLQEPHWKSLQEDITLVFYPFDKYEEVFENAFSYYQYHFPNEIVPELYTYNSGFNYGIYPESDFIGIGLEWYVGSDNEIVKQLPYDAFPNYIKAHMEPEFMAIDAIKGWLLVKYYNDELSQASFLENMIFYGKVMYLVDACFPYAVDDLKIGYSPEEINWVVSNEENIWATIVKEKLLFESNMKIMNQWFMDAPFTAGLPQESPGKVGVWLGWQMVKQYMDENENVNLHQLQTVKAETILKYYKPNK
jgi:hypothetical protein